MNKHDDANEEWKYVLGPEVEVTEEVIPDFASAERAAFELYKETASLAFTTMSIHIGEDDPDAIPQWPRGEAIRRGLLNRIGKFMTAVIQLTASSSRAEVISALSRCILESAVNLEYMCKVEEADQRYIASSLAPDAELYRLIDKNIEARGGEILQIEVRMKSSIERLLRASGMKLEEVDPNLRATNFRDKLKAIGKEDLYLSIGKISSHAIHGTWVDLFLNHLSWNDPASDTFKPEDWQDADARLLTPTAHVVTTSIGSYIFWRYGEDGRPLLDRVDSLMDRLERFEHLHGRLFDRAREERRGH